MKASRVTMLLLCAILAAACAGPPPGPKQGPGAAGPSSQAGTPDGHYRVRRGDSLYTIAFRLGLDWREIARLNAIEAPYTIYPDQLLRLAEDTAPASMAHAPEASGVQIRAVPGAGEVTTRALDESAQDGVTTPATAPAELPADSPREVAAPPPAAPPPASASQAPSGAAYSLPAGDPKRWLWPTNGRLLSTFAAGDPARKGIDIAGRVGQPVVATADGQVVYSGNGLIGYGELVIIKHSDRMLSAYAHNSKRLVGEGQQVTAGTTIAELGTNDRKQALLHFEIRVNGSPQDPLKYLPQR